MFTFFSEVTHSIVGNLFHSKKTANKTQREPRNSRLAFYFYYMSLSYLSNLSKSGPMTEQLPPSIGVLTVGAHFITPLTASAD